MSYATIVQSTLVVTLLATTMAHADYATFQYLDAPYAADMTPDGRFILGARDGSAFTLTEKDGLVLFDTIIGSWQGIPKDIANNGTIIGFDSFQTSQIGLSRRLVRRWHARRMLPSRRRVRLHHGGRLHQAGRHIRRRWFKLCVRVLHVWFA